MSTTISKHEKILKKVKTYYTDKLLVHGATHLGVDWNSVQSQNLRFDQLLKVMGSERSCSVIDYGCGYGAMASYIRGLGYTGKYIGFDISKAMIGEARKQQYNIPQCFFVTNRGSLSVADYTLASGIFNVKLQTKSDAWLRYVLDTIRIMAKHSRKGFSFNMLTSYSDTNKLRPDLFYGDPCFFIDHCIRTYSRHVAILHDYGLYEFTILVRMR